MPSPRQPSPRAGTTAAGAVLGILAAAVLAARTGHLARLGRRTTVRTVRPLR